MRMMSEWCETLAPTTTPTLRLRLGVHLFQGDAGRLLIRTPLDEFVRLQADPMAVRGVLAAFGMPVLPGDAASTDATPSAEAAGVRALLDAFVEQGFAEPDDAAADERVALAAADVTIASVPRNPIAEAVCALLSKAGVARVRLIDTMAPLDLDDTHLRIECAAWLPDARWRELDRQCAIRRRAWLGCYGEGPRFFVGPFAHPGGEASYEDLRARRLAASRAPEELAAHWAFLDRHGHTLPLPWPNAGAISVLAGVLVADAITFLSGGAPATDGWQFGFEPRRLRWSHHPVLAVPKALMSEADDDVRS